MLWFFFQPLIVVLLPVPILTGTFVADLPLPIHSCTSDLASSEHSVCLRLIDIIEIHKYELKLNCDPQSDFNFTDENLKVTCVSMIIR